MKRFKKMMAIVVVAVMTFTMMGTFTFAAKTVDVGTGLGSITLDNGTTGESYQLYKVFDATYSVDNNGKTNVAYTFTKTNDNAPFYNALIADDSPFTLKTTATSEVYTVVKKDGVTDSGLLDWVETKVRDMSYMKVGTAVTLVETDEQQIQWTNLAYGYYLITSTLNDSDTPRSVVTIDSNVPDVTVHDKNQVPSFDKNIVLEENGKEILSKVNNTGIAIDVPFKISVSSKNYEGNEKIFKYVVYDTLDDGFTLQGAPTIKIAGDLPKEDCTITYYTDETKKTEVSVTTDGFSGVQYFEIEIPWTNDGTVNGTHLYKANDSIDVTYHAFLDPEKYDEINFGANPNLNTADTKYYKGPDSDEPSGDLPDKKTETFSTSITILKVDGSSSPLKGAEFTLESENGTKYTIITGQRYVEDANGTYYKLKDGKYTETKPNGSNNSAYEDTQKTYKLEDFVECVGDEQGNTEFKGFVKNDGTLTFKGLFAGKYKLVETVVPEGFNKADDIEFTISFDSNENSATYKKFSCNNKSVVLDGNTNVFKTTVVNNPGTILPSTGGIGTTMFYLIGAILIIGAGVLLVTRRRVEGQQ